MADSKLNALTAATTLNDADILYLVQSAVDKKITWATLKVLIAAYALADSSVSTAKLAAGAVTNAKVDTDAIDTANIVDEAITFAKLSEATALAPIRTKDTLIYDAADATLSFDKTTKILTWDEVMFVFNGSQSSYFRLNAGSLDFSAMTFQSFAYITVSDNFKVGSSTSTAYNAGSIVIKEFNDANLADMRNENGVFLFLYTATNNNISSPFLNTVSNNKLLNGDYNSDKYWFVADDAQIKYYPAAKTISWTDDIFIVNQQGGYARIAAATVTLADYKFAYVTFDPNLSGNQGSLSVQYSVDAWYTENSKDENKILIAIAGASSTQAFNSPLADLANNAEIVRTQDKLFYSCRGEFTYQEDTKIISWDDTAFIFNGNIFLSMSAGSIDLSALGGTTTGFWEIYFEASDNFINGVSGGTISLGGIVKKQYSDAANAIREDNSVILFRYYHQTNKIQSPFFNQQLGTPSYLFKKQKAATAWVNHYSAIYGKLPNFTTKYAGGVGSTAEDYIRIILSGDSIFARENNTSVLNVTPSSYPPTLVTKNIAAYIFENLNLEMPIYRRYDYSTFFTEVGTWNEATTDATWDDSGDRPCHTKLSVSTNASLEFTVSSDYDRFNFIDRTDAAGSNDVDISVSGGNGLVEVKEEGGSWTEANGYNFSQLQATGTRIGNTIYQRRIQFKKVGGGIGTSQTISISKGTADASRLLYWGVEMISGDKPYSQLINASRGGHTLDQLENTMDSDIINFNPDLVVLEIPLINMLLTTWTKEYCVNWLWDFVWGDRPGNTNTWSLKAQASDWADFEVLLIMPHHSRTHFNSDGSFVVSGGLTAKDIYNACKALIYTKGDLGFVDMSSVFLREIDSDISFSNYYTATTGSTLTGNSYLNDTVHQNDKGTSVYAKHICPIFDLTNL